MDLTLEHFGIDRLNPQQKLQLLGLIWDSLPDDVPFTPPDWHLKELERRIALADADPGAAEPWEAVRARLRVSTNRVSPCHRMGDRGSWRG